MRGAHPSRPQSQPSARLASLAAAAYVHVAPLFPQDFTDHLFRLFDKEGRGHLIQEEWIAMLKENVR